MDLQEKGKKQLELVERLVQLTKQNEVAWVKNPLDHTYIAKYKGSHFELRVYPVLELRVDFAMEIEEDSVGRMALDDLLLSIEGQLAVPEPRYNEDDHLNGVLEKLNAQ